MPGTDEGRLRQQVAECTRLLVMTEVMDFSGHVSARIPGTERVLIQPRDTSRAALSADDILVVDLDGRVLEGEGPPPSETALHTEIYRVRPDAVAVCHGHPTFSTLFTVVERPLVAVRNFAFGLADGVPVHPDTTHIRTKEQGEAVARTLAQNSLCLLRGHGTAVAAPSVEELFMHCLDIEENARSLVYAAALGPLLPMTPEEVRELRESYGRASYRAAKVWEHYQHKGRHAGVL